MAARRGEGNCPRPVLDLVLGFQHLESTLHAHGCPLQRAVEPGEHPKLILQQAEVGKKNDDAADSEAPVPGVVHPDPQDHHRRRAGCQAIRQALNRAVESDSPPGRKCACAILIEPLELFVFAAESLHNLDAAQRALNVRLHLALDLATGAAVARVGRAKNHEDTAMKGAAARATSVKARSSCAIRPTMAIVVTSASLGLKNRLSTSV